MYIYYLHAYSHVDGFTTHCTELVFLPDSVVRGFLTKFPFSLPCLVNLLVCLVAVVAVAIWMPETLGAKKYKCTNDCA